MKKKNPVMAAVSSYRRWYAAPISWEYEFKVANSHILHLWGRGASSLKSAVLWATEYLRALNKYLNEIFLQYDQFCHFPTKMSCTLKRPPLCAEEAFSPCICIGFHLPQAEHIQLSRSLLPIDVCVSVVACVCPVNCPWTDSCSWPEICEYRNSFLI